MANAQDARKVDPKHYKVEFENNQVRVLRISYGPHEKSVMHSHPAVHDPENLGNKKFEVIQVEFKPKPAGTH